MSDNRDLSLSQRLHAISSLEGIIASKLADYNNELQPVVNKAYRSNPWFTERFVMQALQNWKDALSHAGEWVKMYERLNIVDPLTVGVVNAGNIPFVGLHDMLSVLIAGHNYQGKNATGDEVLLPYIAELLMEAEPAFRERIKFVDRLAGMDAVIATGNNNSARYFEYYFGKYPHIIRKNRNGVGVLTGNETKEQLSGLGMDIFSYFGLGCRNVSKLYVPEGYVFDKFFEAMLEYAFVNESSKYMNNFEYNNSVLLLKRIPFLQNNFLIIREEKHIASSIAVVHYEKYASKEQLVKQLTSDIESIQCIAAGNNYFDDFGELNRITVPFGQTQSPALWDYADGVDTLRFLEGL